MMRINAQVLPYLTPQAFDKVTELANAGMDIDLAIALVETTMADTDVYELPPQEPIETAE